MQRTLAAASRSGLVRHVILVIDATPAVTARERYGVISEAIGPRVAARTWAATTGCSHRKDALTQGRHQNLDRRPAVRVESPLTPGGPVAAGRRRCD